MTEQLEDIEAIKKLYEEKARIEAQLNKLHPIIPTQPKIIDTSQLTDVGNAKYLLALFGLNLKYVPEWKLWVCWNGSYWDKCLPGRQGYPAQLIDFATRTALALREDAELLCNPEQREKLRKHAQACESWTKIKSMINIAEAGDGVQASPSEFDKNPFLLNLNNGTLNLESGEFREHRREDMITQKSPINYDPHAQCPRWIQFMNRIMQSTPELIPYLQNLAGQMLTGEVREKAFYIFWGNRGDNGKTTFIEQIQYMLNDLAQTIPISALIKEGKDKIPVDLDSLRHARFVFAAEPDIGDELTPGLIKRITGKDTLKTRALFMMPTQWRAQFKLVIATNNKPRIDDPSDAMWGRVKCVPFLERIPKEEQDRTLKDKLILESSGILNWMIEGCTNWLKYGMKEPEIITKLAEEYREDSDKISEFMDYCMVANSQGFMPHNIIYPLYKLWCANHNIFPYAFNKFSLMVENKGYSPFRGYWTDKNGQKSRVRGFIGVTGQTWLMESVQQIMEQIDIDYGMAKYLFGQTGRAKVDSLIHFISYENNVKSLSSLSSLSTIGGKPLVTTTIEDNIINKLKSVQSVQSVHIEKPMILEVIKLVNEEFKDINNIENMSNMVKFIQLYFPEIQINSAEIIAHEIIIGLPKEEKVECFISQQEKINTVLSVIRNLQKLSNGNNSASFDEIVIQSEKTGIGKKFVEDVLERFKSNGDIIETSTGKYKLI